MHPLSPQNLTERRSLNHGKHVRVEPNQPYRHAALAFFAKKRSWTFESSDARNKERNGGDQKQNSTGDFTDDYKLTVTMLGTVIGKGQRK